MPKVAKTTQLRRGPAPRSRADARMIADMLPSTIAKYDKPLTDRQRAFALNIGFHGMSQMAAAKAIGCSPNSCRVTVHRFMTNPKVLQHIRIEQERLAAVSTMTKKKVLDGILEAIDMARLQSEPLTMITGWRDIGKMCGFFEPTRHKIEVSVQGEVVIQRLQQLDDAKLLELAEGNLAALDGEFTVIPP